jgi:uncharacterized membrane protein YbhN (UPF0104 family)
MNKKRLIFWLKLVILLAVLGFVGRFVYHAWHDISEKAGQAKIPLTWQSVEWRYSILAVFAFCGVMLTSGLTWRWLAARMGDRTPALRAMGAYTFSQMGKYVPGKIALLLMRIDRAGRFGMSTGICTLSTLLENALYMISGGLVGMVAIAHIADALPADKQQFRAWIWPATIAAVIVLASACHPTVFYTLVNSLLKRTKRPPVPEAERLKMGTLLLGVLAFVPCWICGGVALWATASCLHPLPIVDCAWFIGAFSLSVIIGMASLLPGGTGIREVVLGTAVGLQFSTVMDHDHAVILGTLVAVLQRVYQVVAEAGLGIAGAILTRKSGRASKSSGY